MRVSRNANRLNLDYKGLCLSFGLFCVLWMLWPEAWVCRSSRSSKRLRCKALEIRDVRNIKTRCDSRRNKTRQVAQMGGKAMLPSRGDPSTLRTATTQLPEASLMSSPYLRSKPWFASELGGNTGVLDICLCGVYLHVWCIFDAAGNHQ